MGQGPNFRYNPSVRPEDISPRSSSSPSSDSSGSPPRSLSSEPEEPDHLPPWTPIKQAKVVAEGNFTIEEMRDSDFQADSDDDLSVVQPDGYEEAEPDATPSREHIPTSNDHEIHDLDQHIDEREAWVRERRRKRRRMDLRTQMHAQRQSIGSDTDNDDLQQFDISKAGSSARRLRRKKGDMGSLIFDDHPRRITELHEHLENGKPITPSWSNGSKSIYNHILQRLDGPTQHQTRKGH